MKRLLKKHGEKLLIWFGSVIVGFALYGFGMAIFEKNDLRIFIYIMVLLLWMPILFYAADAARRKSGWREKE